MDPAGLDPALYADLLAHVPPTEAVEIAVFAAWQANGLRAIHSWDADVLFGSPEVELPYADGPSLFVRRPSPPANAPRISARPEDQVPFPHPRRPADPAALAMLRRTWRQWGCPPEAWLEELAAAPHVLWGWAEFHRLAFAEGLLPRRTKARAIALLALRIGHPAWIDAMAEAELADLREGAFGGFDRKTAAALAYVDRLETDYLRIDDAFFRSLAEALTPGELVELGMLAGLHMGSIRLARVLARCRAGRLAGVAEASAGDRHDTGKGGGT